MTLRDKLGKPVLFHRVGWHGKDGLASSIPGYDSRDIGVIRNQLKAMKELGGDGFGVIALSFGLTSPFITESCLEICNQCAAIGAPFALCMDPWTVAGAKTLVDIDAHMIAALQSSDYQDMLNSPTYLPGKPVLDFGTGCDPKVVTAAVPGITFWVENKDYDWSPYSQAPNHTQLPCVFSQFNDGTGKNRNASVWDPNKPARIVDPKGGDTFWNHAKWTGDPQYVQFLTWDDYTESTAIEPFAAMLSGKIGR